MAFAGDKQYFAHIKLGKCGGNGFVTGHNFNCAIACVQNGAANGCRVFGSRIVIGYNDMVGNLACNLSHHFAFARVTLTTASK